MGMPAAKLIRFKVRAIAMFPSEDFSPWDTPLPTSQFRSLRHKLVTNTVDRANKNRALGIVSIFCRSLAMQLSTVRWLERSRLGHADPMSFCREMTICGLHTKNLSTLNSCRVSTTG